MAQTGLHYFFILFEWDNTIPFFVTSQILVSNFIIGSTMSAAKAETQPLVGMGYGNIVMCREPIPTQLLEH